MDLSQLVAGFTGGGGGGGGGGGAAAAAGMAAAGPYGAALGAVASALGTTPSSAVSGDERNTFFQNAGAGWTVSTGRSSASGAPINTPELFGLDGAGAGMSGNVLLLAGAAVVVALVLTRKGR